MSALGFVQNQKKTRNLIILVSLVIPVVVTALRYIPTPDFSEAAKHNLYYLPFINAVLNGSTFLLLIGALWAIKNKKIDLHRKLTTSAVLLSALFLVSYVIFHWTCTETPYGGEGALKTFYYIILITHILLSAVIVPLVLFAFTHAVAGRYDKHKRVVKFAYPMWIYVTFTGVLVYWMIQPYYPYSIF
jgi:putative membrane protein